MRVRGDVYQAASRVPKPGSREMKVRRGERRSAHADASGHFQHIGGRCNSVGSEWDQPRGLNMEMEKRKLTTWERATVDVSKPNEVVGWCNKWGVTPERLKAAVAEVGTSA